MGSVKVLIYHWQVPQTREEWVDVAKLFEDLWQMPHCIGALDGKHVRIKCPNNAGSAYFNYKGFHSIVMMALADADAKFLYVSAGAKGSWSDGGIYRRSDLYANLHRLQIPEPEPLEAEGPDSTYCFVGDDPLQWN
jgi:hypothetical protein